MLPTGTAQTGSLWKELHAEIALNEGAVTNEALEFQLLEKKRKKENYYAALSYW